jgi:RNA polymerase sigma-70 factor, ECF subfamily
LDLAKTLMRQIDDFQTVVDAYGSDLYRFAYWLCRNEHTAEDLVQETFLRAWRSFSSLRDASAAKAWLLTTLRREHYRRKPVVQTFSIDDEQVSDAVYGLEAQLNPDEELDLEKRLSELPEQYREVLVLQLLFGYSTQEIAALLNTTEPAVANRLLRARKQLQSKVEAPSASTARAQMSAQVIELRKRPS